MLSSAMHRAVQQLLHMSGALSFTITEPGFPAADVMLLGPQAPEKAGVGGLRSWHPLPITDNQSQKTQFSTGFPDLGLTTESRLKCVPIFLRKRPICLWGAPAWSTAHIPRPCRGCAQTPLREVRRHLGDPQPPHGSFHACPEPQDLPRLQRSHLQTAWLR